MVESVDDLKTSQSIEGHRFSNLQMFDAFYNFEMRHAKIAPVLKKIITNPNFKKRVHLEEQKALMQDQFLRGRQDCVHDLRILSSDRKT